MFNKFILLVKSIVKFSNLIQYLNNWINYEKQLVRIKEQIPVKVSVS